MFSATKRMIAASSSSTDRNTPRLRRRLVSLAKKPSTALSQDARGGCEVECPAGMPGQPFLYLRMLVGRIVVDDGVDRLSCRHLRLDGGEKADELLVPVAVHVAADDGAVEDVEGSKQCRRTVALVIVGHSPGTALLHRQTRLGAVERLDLALLINREDNGVSGRISPRSTTRFPHPPRRYRWRCCSRPVSAHASSGLIHSDDSQIGRSSSSSLHESRNCRQRHAGRSPSA